MPHNLPEYSVSEIAGAVKQSLEQAFGHVRIRGEISGYKRVASGHVYFCLKDEKAVLDACCWKMTVDKLKLDLSDGIEVIATGRLTTHGARSKYQLIIEDVALAGRGALLAMIEERRLRLDSEGLFAAARKRSLPIVPNVIGIVTSPTGAVIRDILHRLAERFPRPVLLWPVLVQGEQAAAQIVAAIQGFNALVPGGEILRPDLLILARGGGSIEDLMAFNDEAVVRAVAASIIPTIAAIGHETDTTLVDFAADRRAPTPTAAAEFAVPVRFELRSRLASIGMQLERCLIQDLKQQRLRLTGFNAVLQGGARLLEPPAQRLDDWAERLANLAQRLTTSRRGALAMASEKVPQPQRQLILASQRLSDWRERLPGLAQRAIYTKRERFNASTGRLAPLTTRVLLAARQLSTESRALNHRLSEGRANITQSLTLLHRYSRETTAAITTRLIKTRQDATHQSRLLEGYSYRATLARGFVLVHDKDGRLVKTKQAANAVHSLALEFTDGPLDVVTLTGMHRAAPAVAKPRRETPIVSVLSPQPQDKLL